MSDRLFGLALTLVMLGVVAYATQAEWHRGSRRLAVALLAAAVVIGLWTALLWRVLAGP